MVINLIFVYGAISLQSNVMTKRLAEDIDSMFYSGTFPCIGWSLALKWGEGRRKISVEIISDGLNKYR